MNHRTLMKLSAVFAAVFAIMMLLMPNRLMAIYGVPAMNGPGVYNSMLLGAFLAGYAAMNWSASDSPLAEVRHVLLNDVVASVLGFVVVVYRQFTVDARASGWFNVLMFLCFALAFVWVYIKRPEETMRSAHPA